MKWNDISTKSLILRDGELVIAKVDKQYVHAGYKLGVYKNGSIWDAMVIDDPMMWQEEWTIMDDVTEKFACVGVNVFKEKYNVN